MENKIPNPDGKKGSQSHQDKIDEIAKSIFLRGYVAVREKLFRLINGKKSKRFADVVAVDENQTIIEIH